MSNLTIGRIGLDVDVDGVLQWEFDGDTLRVELEIYSSTADALVIRQQILGYTSTADESYVPVTWDMEPDADGYYTVESASVTPHPDGADLWYVDVKLRRVLGYSAPLLEMISVGALRASSHLVAGQGVHLYAIPYAARSAAVYNLTTGVYASAVAGYLRSGASGDIRRIGASDDDPRLVQFYVAPEYHYSGAATLYVGDGLRAAVGRQVANTPTAWRLSNGLLEVEPVASSSFDLRMRMWLSATAAWSPWVSFTMLSADSPAARTPMPVPHAITVLRNGPEEVAIRILTATKLAGGAAFTGASSVTVDVSLKRGARHVAVELRSTVANLFGFRCASFAGATAVTTEENRTWKAIGAVHMVAMAPYTITQTGDDVYPNEGAVTNVSAWSFGLGMVEASAPVDDHQDTAAEYFYASAAKQSVVAQ